MGSNPWGIVAGDVAVGNVAADDVDAAAVSSAIAKAGEASNIRDVPKTIHVR
jgi:hypothetical protein